MRWNRRHYAGLRCRFGPIFRRNAPPATAGTLGASRPPPEPPQPE
jgi:hypothetical protein